MTLSIFGPSFFVGLCALAVAALLYAEHREKARLKSLFKPAASLAFIAAGIASGALDSAFGQAILAGLALCAIGDVLLIPRSGPSFLAGMAAFAAGHAAYIAAFLIGGVEIGAAALAAAVAAALFSGGVLVHLWGDLGPFRPPVAAYGAIISIMVAASVAHWAAAPGVDAARLALAAAGFAVSDLAVARDQFRRRHFANRLWGLPLYYASQCLFAISV